MGSWRSRGAHRACRAWRRGPMRPRTARTAAHPAAKCDSRECYSTTRRGQGAGSLSVGVSKSAVTRQRHGSPHGSTSIGLITIFTRISKIGIPKAVSRRGEAGPTKRRSRTGAPCNKGVGDVGTGPNSRTEQNRSYDLGRREVGLAQILSLLHWCHDFICSYRTRGSGRRVGV